MRRKQNEMPLVWCLLFIRVCNTDEIGDIPAQIYTIRLYMLDLYTEFRGVFVGVIIT